MRIDSETVQECLRREIMSGEDFDDIIPGSLMAYEDMLEGSNIDEIDQEVVDAIIAKYF